jgi:hypothetical protein
MISELKNECALPSTYITNALFVAAEPNEFPYAVNVVKSAMKLGFKLVSTCKLIYVEYGSQYPSV